MKWGQRSEFPVRCVHVFAWFPIVCENGEGAFLEYVNVEQVWYKGVWVNKRFIGDQHKYPDAERLRLNRIYEE